MVADQYIFFDIFMTFFFSFHIFTFPIPLYSLDKTRFMRLSSHFLLNTTVFSFPTLLSHIELVFRTLPLILIHCVYTIISEDLFNYIIHVMLLYHNARNSCVPKSISDSFQQLMEKHMVTWVFTNDQLLRFHGIRKAKKTLLYFSLIRTES